MNEIYISESVIGNDRKVAEHLKEMMWKFSVGSKEYELAQKCFAFVVNRMRSKEKVILSAPAKVGSLREKLEHEVWLDSVN